jgi:Phosphatidylserine synthase
MGIKKSIPNFITLLNLLCGILAVIYAFKGYNDISIYLIIAAAVMDFFDGFFARILDAYSDIGKELDSLADLISFGLAPSIILFITFEEYLASLNGGLDTYSRILSFVPLIIVLASAFRLALFNVDIRQKEDFIGLPTPANALLIGTLVHFTEHSAKFHYILDNLYIIPLLTIVLSYLLICRTPMFSIKFKNFELTGNKIRISFLAISALLSIPVILSGSTWSLWALTVFVFYIFFNIALSINDKLYRAFKKHR